MLLRFRVSNFRSFRTEQTLSMVAGPIQDRVETVFHPSGVEDGVLPVAAIYGANASGKTNVILALQFMRAAVQNSHARWEPDKPIQLEPFAGESASPTTLAVDFLLDGVRYQYGFSMSPEAVLEEWVFAYPLGKKQTWFARKNGKPISFSAKLAGDNRTIERLIRPNSLFLSAAAQNNHEALSPIFRCFSRSLSFVVGERSEVRRQTIALCQDAAFRDKLAGLLSLADLGIADLLVEDAVMPESGRELAHKLGSFLQGAFKIPFNLHEKKEVHFLHRIGDSTLPFREEQESKVLADSLRIDTQKFESTGAKKQPLSVEVNSAGRYVVLRPNDEPRDGTAVTLALDIRSRKHRWREDKYHDDFDHPLMVLDFASEILRTLAVHVDIPIEISHGDQEITVIEPQPFSIPEIDPNTIPCMQEDRFQEFVFTYDYKQTNGLAGTFRFLIPKNAEGKLCLLCWVESLFKMFIDPDGDLCLASPRYKDDRVDLDVNVSEDWGWSTDELRGVYRHKFDRK